MRVSGGSHLTYCSNIHPGESLDEITAMLTQNVAAVRKGMGLTQPMGLGLRLSDRATRDLEAPGRLHLLAAQLERLGLYVFTLNGFPYGVFHGEAVKDQVYLPDWRQPERLDYSNRLARILAHLLPDGVNGSISTVPGAYKAHLLGSDAEMKVIAEALARHGAELHGIFLTTGKKIALGLEPEPGCLLESSRDAVAFFRQWVYGPQAVAVFRQMTGLGWTASEEALRRHLGLCLDACHAAIGYEDPDEAVALLEQAEIPIVKIQLSSGLEAAHPGPTERSALRPFAEETYLHQVVARDVQGNLRSYADLPEALADPTDAESWRIHFHLPLWAEELDGFSTTAPWLERLLSRHRQRPISDHLEVETYTWSVLDPRFRPLDLSDAIVKELQWVRTRLP